MQNLSPAIRHIILLSLFWLSVFGYSWYTYEPEVELLSNTEELVYYDEQDEMIYGFTWTGEWIPLTNEQARAFQSTDIATTGSIDGDNWVREND